MKENSWRELFMVMPFPCMALKPMGSGEFDILEVNEAYLQVAGVEDLSCFLKKWGELMGETTHAESAALSPIKESLVRLMQTSKKQSLAFACPHFRSFGLPEKSETCFQIENIPLLDEDGNVEIILHSLKDISLEKKLQLQQKEFEAELDINRQQFKNFIRENPDGLYRLDLEGNFIHANEGLANLAQLPLEELSNMNFLSFCAPEHQDLVKENFRQATGGKIVSFEADFHSAEGQQGILKILLMPMVLNGKVTEVHGIAKDVTYLRRSQKVIIEKSRFLKVNADFISSLLENEINDQALYETFEIIAKTVEADRMYYFGADKDPETGEILISQKVEWCSKKATPQINNPELQKMPIRRVKEITSPLTRNLAFKATFSELAEGELREIFIDQDIKSMLLLPIFLEEQLFGFVGFDDCTRERSWKAEEISFLRSLTQNLTSALEKTAALEKARKSEEELRISEQKFRALVQEGSDLIGILNIEGHYSFVSENYKNILGFDPSELIGKNAYHFIHPEDWERVKEQFFKLKDEKQTRISPFRFKNKKGEYRWMQTTATNLLNDSAVNGIVANSKDVTTVIEQAREIEHINERYQLAATATEDLVYDWDLNSNEILRFHRGLKELFGYSSQEVNKREFWRQHVHPEDLAPEKKKLARAIADPSQSFIKTEYRFRRADGSYAQVVDKGYILRDSFGKAIRIIGATSDISEITAKKEALKIANERFKMAMKATNEMIWDWEICNDSVTRSKGYKNIFGYDTNEATSVHSFWLTKVVAEDLEKVKSSLEKAIKNPRRKKWQLEYRLVKADGNYAYVIDRGYILRNKEGKATRMVGAVLDVTESRKLLLKIQKQNKILKEIAWEQSHVVRAPLARIKGLLHLLEQEQVAEMSQEDILFHIKDSANELDRIIKKIVKKSEKMNVDIS